MNDFISIFNMDAIKFEIMLNSQRKPKGEKENFLVKYQTPVFTDWYNFQMIDTKPLPLVFDFIKTLDLV